MNINKKTTDEFTKADWTAWRKAWVDDYMAEIECTKQEASIWYEEYLNQEGYTRRDERIRMLRDCR